jgi:hypothetical protein
MLTNGLRPSQGSEIFILLSCNARCSALGSRICSVTTSISLLTTPNSIGYLKSNGRHTDTVDGTELKIAEGKLASTDITAVQNFMQAAVFIGRNY